MKCHLLAAAASVLVLAGAAQPAAGQTPGVGGSQSARQSVGTVQVGGGNANPSVNAPVAVNTPVTVASDTGGAQAGQGDGNAGTGLQGTGGGQSADESVGTVQVGGGNANPAVNAPVAVNMPVAVASDTGDGAASLEPDQPDGGAADPDPGPGGETPATEPPAAGTPGNLGPEGAAPSSPATGGSGPGTPGSPTGSGTVGDTGGSTGFGDSHLGTGTGGDVHLAAWTPQSRSAGRSTGGGALAAIRTPASGTLANSGRELWAVVILALLLLAAAGALRLFTQRRAA